MSEADFSKFEGKYVLNCRLLTLEPMRIGCSEPTGDTLSSSPIIVDNEGKPFIPGTSLKGVLRSVLERVYSTFGLGDSLQDIDALFGSRENKGKIIVHDAYLDSSIAFNTIEDKAHYGGGHLIPLEAVGVGLLFDVKIDIINGNEIDAGNLFIALGELDSLRSGIGSWRSRGYGLVQVQGMKFDIPVSLNYAGSSLEWQEIDVEEIQKKAENRLRGNNSKSANPNDFSSYSHAFDETAGGTVACEFEIELVTDFHVKGMDEATVLSTDEPYIPGSVIKGFLHWQDFENFTSPKDHRSNIIVRGAFIENYNESCAIIDEKKTINAIKKGTKLRSYIIFDNMAETNIASVISKLSKNNPITKQNEKKKEQQNLVKFKLISAVKFYADEEGFSLDVIKQLNDAVKKQKK